MIKICTKCKERKESQNFSPGSSWCKVCRQLLMQDVKKRKKELGKQFLRPERRQGSSDDDVIDPADWEKLILHVKTQEVLIILDVTQSLGLRIHEALQMTKEDLDIKEKTVNIHSLKRSDENTLILYVRPDLFDMLCYRPSGRLFNRSYGGIWQAFRTALKRAGLNPKFRIHHLRKLFASRLTSLGAHAFEIQSLLRHTVGRKGIGQTQGYTKVSKARRKELLEKTWEGQTWIWKELSKRETTNGK